VSLHFINSPGRGNSGSAVRARERRLPPNPLAIEFHGRRIHFVLDFTASVVPEGKVLVALNSGALLPEGAAIDAEGTRRAGRGLLRAPRGALLRSAVTKAQGFAGHRHPCRRIDPVALQRSPAR